MEQISEHQIEVAKQTLNMTDCTVNMVGGPTKEQAFDILIDARCNECPNMKDYGTHKYCRFFLKNCNEVSFETECEV